MVAVLRMIEGVVFFLAMMLAIVLEGGIVYWLCQYPPGQDTSFGITGQWTAPALPQAWLLGALFMLAHRLTAMFRPAANNATEDMWRKRKDFLRLWHWTIALIAMQGFAFFLDRVAGA